MHCLAHPAPGLRFEQFSWIYDHAPDLAAFWRARAPAQQQRSAPRTAFLWTNMDKRLLLRTSGWRAWAQQPRRSEG